MGDHPCTPESTAACCDTYGRMLTTEAACPVEWEGETSLGYCGGAGDCAAHFCKTEVLKPKPENAFCGASKINPCKASCLIGEDCYDTATFLDGGDPLQDGSICLKDNQRGA